MGSEYNHYIRRLLSTIGIIAIAVSLFLLLWHLAYVLLLLFGGALFAVFLVGLAREGANKSSKSQAFRETVN